MSPQRRALDRDGFVAFPGALPGSLIARLRDVTDHLIDAADTSRHRTQGSMLPTNADPAFADLIAAPEVLAAFAALGFSDPSFSDGYVIAKPPGGPRLFWHYDWFAWEDPRSRELPAPQCFAMVYLTDTSRANGCLRAIPGSHLRENPLHRLLEEPHSAALAQGIGDGSAFSDRPDEVDVPVRAGDLLIGDARLLHAAHANGGDARRTLITLWYQPDLASLPERMRAQMAVKTQPIPDDWPAEARAKVAPLLASRRHTGDAVPYGRQLWRPSA